MSAVREAAILRRVARNILPKSVRHRVGVWYGERGMERLPDRVYLTQNIIPVVASRGGTVLFVGCRPYTKAYPTLLEQHGARCWTIDVDPEVARWGAPGRHVVAAIQAALAHWPPAFFDTVVLSGVFGYGLNERHDQETALRVARQLLKPGGWFVLGWNTDRTADPLRLPTLQQQFQPASLQGLPLRQSFPVSTHVFDFFLAAGLVSQEAADADAGSTHIATLSPPLSARISRASSGEAI